MRDHTTVERNERSQGSRERDERSQGNIDRWEITRQ